MPALIPGNLPGHINVAIVDDHRMFAECLSRLLGDQDGIQVIGTAINGLDAMALIAEHPPHVLLVDYQMPKQNGVALALEIRRVHPDMAVVMLSEVDCAIVAREAIDAGCSGFLTKSASIAEVSGAVRASAAGGAHISPALLVRLLRSRNDNPDNGSVLTARERDTLVHIARGGTSKVIAVRMGVTTSTVRNSVQSILHKLGAHSKLEAVTTAARRGILAYPTSD